jgi:hypothetical protein
MKTTYTHRIIQKFTVSLSGTGGTVVAEGITDGDVHSAGLFGRLARVDVVDATGVTGLDVYIADRSTASVPATEETVWNTASTVHAADYTSRTDANFAPDRLPIYCPSGAWVIANPTAAGAWSATVDIYVEN